MAFDVDIDKISKDPGSGSTKYTFGVPQFHAMDRKWRPAQVISTEITADIFDIE
jgi:hypothetical protein